jgi:translation initiation factor IF-2
VGLAAALTGGGSGSAPSRASKQPGALGAPLAFPPLASSESATYAADQATATIAGPSSASVPDGSATSVAAASSSPAVPVSQDAVPSPLAVQTTAVTPGHVPTTTTAAAPPPPQLTYSGITGWACAHNGAATFRPVGESDGSTDGWKILTANDGTGSGCAAGFLAMPMSGDARTDAANHSDWTFSLAPVTHGTCQITVYVPRPASSALYEAGGTAALYSVYSGPSVAGLALIDSFPVDQAAHRGGGVTVSVAVDQPLLRVRLHDQGVDYTSSPKLMYGVAAVRVTCQGT